jgi:hypothetical protein
MAAGSLNAAEYRDTLACVRRVHIVLSLQRMCGNKPPKMQKQIQYDSPQRHKEGRGTQKLVQKS